MVNARLSGLTTAAVETFKRLLAIALYLGVLLSLFAMHKAILLQQGNLIYHIAFSFLNGFVLAKVILIGQELHIGDSFRARPLVYVILFKSMIFSVLLFVFKLLEEGLLALHHDKNFMQGVMEAYPALMQDKLMGIALACLIIFISLIPFFAYLELERVLGSRNLRQLIFKDAQNFQISGLEMSKENLSQKSQGKKSSSTTSRIWYFEKAGATLGPHSEVEIAQFIQSQEIGPKSFVFNALEGGDWRLIEETTLIDLFDQPLGRDNKK
ncbi:MAG: hypothetical protein ACKOPH_03170 [Methylocystis sp.]